METFIKWCEIFGGHTPPKQDPTAIKPNAFADFHGEDQTDPRNPDGQLPPIKKKKMKK